MSEKHHIIPVWFFVGVLLLVYGTMILASGIYEWAHPPENRVVLYDLHADIWWGGLLVILGLIYSLHFRPRGGKPAEDKP
jgi:uncharacterized membrane protein